MLFSCNIDRAHALQRWCSTDLSKLLTSSLGAVCACEKGRACLQLERAYSFTMGSNTGLMWLDGPVGRFLVSVSHGRLGCPCLPHPQYPMLRQCLQQRALMRELTQVLPYE